MVQQTAVNVNVGMPVIQFHAAKQGHGFLVRALWFVCVGLLALPRYSGTPLFPYSSILISYWTPT
jgi:hypothetical protein